MSSVSWKPAVSGSEIFAQNITVRLVDELAGGFQLSKPWVSEISNLAAGKPGAGNIAAWQRLHAKNANKNATPNRQRGKSFALMDGAETLETMECFNSKEGIHRKIS